MDRYVIAGGLIIAAAAVIFAWGLCRAAARPMPAPDHADDCPYFVEPPDQYDFPEFADTPIFAAAVRRQSDRLRDELDNDAALRAWIDGAS